MSSSVVNVAFGTCAVDQATLPHDGHLPSNAFVNTFGAYRCTPHMSHLTNIASLVSSAGVPRNLICVPLAWRDIRPKRLLQWPDILFERLCSVQDVFGDMQRF